MSKYDSQIEQASFSIAMINAAIADERKQHREKIDQLVAERNRERLERKRLLAAKFNEVCR